MNLATSYLGLSLDNPLIASSSPANAQLAHLRRLEDAGIAAVVLPSLFQEQIEAEQERLAAIIAQGQDNNPEAQGYLPPHASAPYGVGPDGYLELIRTAKAALGIPVIASLNGASTSGWTDYAALIEQAGADALELNIYYVPVDIQLSGAALERRYLEVLEAVRSTVRIPVVAKLPPYFSSFGHLATQMVEAGADGLVIFNRYIEPDIDLLRLRLSRELALSQSEEMRLPLQWIALLAGRVDCALAASTGVETAQQVIKYLLAGADVVMTTSALLRHGPGHVRTLLDGLGAWLAARNLEGLGPIRGAMSWSRLGEPGAYARANYIELIEAYSLAHR